MADIEFAALSELVALVIEQRLASTLPPAAEAEIEPPKRAKWVPLSISPTACSPNSHLAALSGSAAPKASITDSFPSSIARRTMPKPFAEEKRDCLPGSPNEACLSGSRATRDDWSLLFSMQHYGAPTRLLDWTENLFVAAYFASQPYTSSEEQEAAGDGRPALWTLDPVAWNGRVLEHIDADLGILTTSDPEIKNWEPRSTAEDLAAARRNRQPIALYGIHNSPRIVAQRGTFTIAGSLTDSMEAIAHDRYPEEPLLVKYVYTGDRSGLAAELHSVGIQRSMVFLISKASRRKYLSWRVGMIDETDSASESLLEQQITLRRREIFTEMLSMSVGELTTMYADGDLIIQPEFQRLFRWDETQKSSLVESILLGIPVPSIFVSTTTDGRWELIDGLQRVSTLLQLQDLLKSPEESNNRSYNLGLRITFRRWKEKYGKLCCRVTMP